MSANDPIRAGTPQDTGEIVHLLQTCLTKTAGIPRSAEFWNWKHFQNPFGSSPFLVYTHEQSIVGLRAFLRWQWRSNSNIFRAVRAVDTATHPDWQRKGIFSRLTTTLLEAVRQDGDCFVFNTPNSSSLPGYLKMGWDVVTKVPLWFRPLKPFSMLWKGSVAPQTSLESRSNLWPDETSLQRSMELIHARNGNENRLHTSRDAEFLKWRYQKIPGLKYQARVQIKMEASAVLIARERLRRGMQEFTISELLLTPDGIPLAIDALQDMISGSTADYAVCIAAHQTPEETVLKKCGFFPLGKRGPALTFRKLNDCSPAMNFLDWANWRCSIGDLEIF